MIPGTRLRIGRWVLLAEGIVMGVFGGAGLAWSMANPQFGAEGAPILWLHVTPMHCALMLGAGVLTLFASLGRTAVLFSRIASVGWLVLTIVCISAAASHTPGPLGFDTRDSLLYGILALYNLALVLWFTVGVKHHAPPAQHQTPARLAKRNPDTVPSS
ncbi:DUF4383 domain-containing protein [Mycobacterium sp. OTB74]|jgi:hypothetical protein|uniref:DUF4383 domain-containing protein n=1 Tax=Mycobacterium sp. OTB74 TaxID=1853452 RepID=UPI002474547B|nr:DUF4383 domain-containing protein [Mycobacterium sp. OTB74]MDH6246278.1 hypothetical protein [Mycobacterium sp. OTB74]